MLQVQGLPVPKPAQQPRFKSGVDRIVVDVQVVDRQGRPVPLLGPDDFEVKISQRVRPVTSVEYIRVADIETAAGGAAKPTADPAQPVETRRAGRDFILAVDEGSFRTNNAPAAIRAARGFIARLAPEDRVGLFTYPTYPRFFTLTPDHASVLRQLDRVMGTFTVPASQFHLSPSEVMDIVAGDRDVVARVAARECLPQYRADCMQRIPGEANLIVMAFESQATASMAALRILFAALVQDPNRKTVVVVSGGLLASDRVGGRPDISAAIQQMGYEAAESGANLYVLHMDSSFLDAFSAASTSRISTSLMRESSAFESGLDRLADAGGGARIHVSPGGEDAAFNRVLRETSSYYLLGVEPFDEDRDGRLHYIQVKVKLPGADVRARRTIVIPAR